MSAVDTRHKTSINQNNITSRQDNILSGSDTISGISSGIVAGAASDGDFSTRQASSRQKTARRGYSLSEALIWLTILCIAFIFGMQWYLNHQKETVPFAASNSSAVMTDAALFDTDDEKAFGQDSNEEYAEVFSEASSEDVVFEEEPLPAGAPAVGEGMVIQFGTGDTAIRLHVPGRAVVSTMPVGMADQEADIHWFFPD